MLSQIAHRPGMVGKNFQTQIRIFHEIGNYTIQHKRLNIRYNFLGAIDIQPYIE